MDQLLASLDFLSKTSVAETSADQETNSATEYILERFLKALELLERTLKSISLRFHDQIDVTQIVECALGKRSKRVQAFDAKRVAYRCVVQAICEGQDHLTDVVADLRKVNSPVSTW